MTAHSDEPAVLAIKAGHRETMAVMDAQSLARMPLPLRMIFDDRLRAKVENAAKDMAEAKGFTPTHLLTKTAACKVAKEDEMSRIFTQAALQGRSLPELRALFQAAQQELVCSECGSHERSDALTNLDTISRAIAHRYNAGPRL